VVIGHPFAPLWQNGGGPAVHYQPVSWPAEPANPLNCGNACGDWKPYTRFNRSLIDPRTQDPSNGGTAPQNYVNVSSSCTDKSLPSIYYYLHRDAFDPAKDVLMFRWRVEQPAHNYATGPSAGTYSSSNPWSSALWTVLFDVDGSGYRSLAAHLNGSSGSPSEAIDLLAGIWGETPSQSLDYINDPKVHLLGHNPTALIGATNRILNFQSALAPVESWPNGAGETSWDYGTTRAKKISTTPCTEYFIDYQIPVAMLDASSVGGPKITRDTPIAMLFCSANSLNNPFQKDCALNRTWSANAAAAAPFGDYLSFNKTESYQQPIVSKVTAEPPNTCPGTYKLAAKVQDALALNNGVVTPSIKSVEFYYWHDRDGDGEATAGDTGSQWTRITPAATLQAQSLNTWTAEWAAAALPKGKYLIGVQAVDDSTQLDDGMTATGVDHRTFSYLSGDADNKIYISGNWRAGQQAAFPAHSPAQAPASSEEWFGNPSVTGNQVALVGTAINVCGVAPTIAFSATPGSVATGASVGFAVVVANPSTNANAISVDALAVELPDGFAYVNGTSSGATSANPSINGQQLQWSLGSPLNVSPGSNVTLSFTATAGSIAGTFNAVASADTSFGALSSAPAAVAVDAARVSLSSTPSTYSIAANGATPLTFTLTYANDSNVAVSAATITNPVPGGATYVSCSGGTVCSESGGNVSWTLGSIAANSSGTVTYTITVPNSWVATSLTSAAALSATAPDSSNVGANASSTVAVTGLAGASAAMFRLSKSAGAVSIAPGGAVTFTLTYENYGASAASGVVLTDTLPSGFSYSSCSDGCSQNSGVVTWNIGSVAASATGTRTVTVTAASPFTAINPAVNNASISWSGGGPVTARADVGVTGQSCSTYYFQSTSANVGFDGTQRIAALSPVPQAANTGTKVTATAPVSTSPMVEVLRFYQDPLSPNDLPFNGNITTNIYIDRANGQGLNIRATVYDYNSATGAKTQLAQNTSLFNGSTKGLLSFAVTPSGTLAKGHRLLWVYEAGSNHNSQTVQAEFQFAGTVANGVSGGTTFANSNAQFCVTPPANLTLKSSVDVASIAENTTPTLTYTLNYANTGSAQATNLSLQAALPSNFTGCEYSTNNSTWNSCSNAGGSPPSHTFNIASVAGGGAGTVYVRGVVPANTSGPAMLTATSTLTSDQTTQVSASASTVVTGSNNGGAPELSLNLLSNRTTAAPGQSVVYTATIVNTGDAAASNVVLTNALPNFAYFTYAGCTGGCNNAAGTLTWPIIATLAAGASQTFTYTMTVGTSGLPAGVTTISDDMSASGDGGLSATSNAVGVSINGNPVLAANYSAVPSGGLEPGDNVTYTLNVTNTGAASANAVAVATTLPANTTFVSTPTGTFDAVNNRVTFASASLASLGSASFSFVARVNTPLPSGNTLLVSTADLSASNASQQIFTATATASAAPLLYISHDAPASIPLPSAVLTSAAAGTTVFVDRTDRFSLAQLVRVGNDIAAITGIGARSLTLDSPVSAASGSPVYGAVALTITYRNDGNANATGVTLRESLPTGLTYYDAEPDATTSPIVGNSGDIDWSIGTVVAGAGGNVQVIAFPSGATGSFASVATISAANAATQTATAVTAIGGLSITKMTSTPVVSAGDTATYTIVAANSLPGAVLVDITDVLPEGFVYQNGSALVGGSSIEPTFSNDDSDHLRPTWSGVQVPGNGSLAITFDADIGVSAGAAAYQNELEVGAPAGVAVMKFDPLSTTLEDVRVLAGGEGVLKGYVFRRFSNSSGNFDGAIDAPLAGVRVEIHKPVYDCATGVDCYVAYSDSNGYFEAVTAAGDWVVSVIAGSGALEVSWSQVAGSNNDTVNVPAQASVTDHNGYRALGAAHLVSATAGAGGTISPTSNSVQEGLTTSFTVTPNVGYVVDDVSGCGGTLAGDTFTTAAITGACSVSATFLPATYTVTSSAGAGGSIGPASAMVSYGATTTFAVTPSANYNITSVSGCGGSLAGNVYTTGPIVGACAVTASFASTSHIVSAAAGAGGSITPPSSAVAHGATTTFNVTASTGYTIVGVTGCGGSLTGSTYTTAPVTGACAVTASFASIRYNVTANAGPGGVINPSLSSVAHGSTATFSVVPDAGGRIAVVQGCGGTLAGSTYTTQPITRDCAVAATFTTLGPSISTPPPARMNARSLFTSVPQSLAPTAIDGAGNALPVTLVGGPLQLVPGRHVITWRAQDAMGRSVTVDQQLDIWPMVSLGRDLMLDFGATGEFDVLLNGQAPQYPYTIAFTVGGDGGYGAKHLLAAGTVTFLSGLEKSVRFDTVPQSSAPPDHRLTVALDPTENLGERNELSILLRATNFAPRVQILTSQADRIGTLIAKDAGLVTLHAITDDANVTDSHTYLWTYPTGLLVQVSADGRELTFDPRALTTNLPSFTVVATDNGNPALQGQARTDLGARSSSPTLGSGDSNGNGIPDVNEGWEDSGNGIPRYLARVTARNVLPENAPVIDQYLIESEASVRLRVGAAAQISGDGGARLGSAGIPTDEIENVGGFFSFEAHALASEGEQVLFVIPQRAGIPKQALYRMWDQDKSQWKTFVEDGRNRLYSAAGEPGFCPPPASSSYTSGLTPGHLCVRVLIEDGGLNDLDHQANTVIVNTGGVGQRPEVEVTGTSSGSGGGGAMGPWMMMFGLLALLRLRRRAVALVAVLLVPVVASSAERDAEETSLRGWMLGGHVMGVRGSVDAAEMDARIARQGYETQTQLSGQSRLGGMLFGGYRWPHLGLEGAYVDLGEMTTRVSGRNEVTDEYLLAVSRSHPQSGSGPQFSMLGYWPLGEKLELVGRAGAFYWKSNMDAQGRQRYRDVDDRALDPVFGFGLNYRASPRWTATVQLVQYRLAGERIDTLSLGVVYRRIGE
jgi:uncharacterized repeat protein (TIGR01451 family)